MEQLNRLSDAIASAYLNYLRHTTGGTRFEHDGWHGEITHDNLSYGLMINAIAIAKGNSAANAEAVAYGYLSPLLCLEGCQYRVTEWGVHVIEFMTRKALEKNHKPAIH